MGHVEDVSIAALEELYRRSYRRFLRLAIAVAGSREAADDAVQEGFARALRRRHDFRGEGSLEGWVWRTVLNAALAHGRTIRRETPLDESPAADNGRPLPAPELRAAIPRFIADRAAARDLGLFVTCRAHTPAKPDRI